MELRINNRSTAKWPRSFQARTHNLRCMGNQLMANRRMASRSQPMDNQLILRLATHNPSKASLMLSNLLTASHSINKRLELLLMDKHQVHRYTDKLPELLLMDKLQARHRHTDKLLLHMDRYRVRHQRTHLQLMDNNQGSLHTVNPRMDNLSQVNPRMVRQLQLTVNQPMDNQPMDNQHTVRHQLALLLVPQLTASKAITSTHI